MIDEIQLQEIFQIAITAAQSAGQFIMKNIDKAIKIEFKGRANAVTEIDRKSEEIIISQILGNFPDHQIIAEESEKIQSDSKFCWIIDPLDGTTNFIHGFPCFSVSIGVEYQREIIIGVVYNVILNELFSAIRDRGAYLNKKPIHVSKIATVADSLTATGFPYELNRYFEMNMEIFKHIYRKSQGVRRVGSAAVDLCYVAMGRFDGFWEFDLNAWDVSAGALIVEEAGGKVTNIDAGLFDNRSRQIIASNGLIHDSLVSEIRTIIDK